MSCTSAKTIYASCGHSTCIPVSCACSGHNFPCSRSDRRVILTTSYEGYCQKDTHQQRSFDVKELANTCALGLGKMKDLVRTRLKALPPNYANMTKSPVASYDEAHLKAYYRDTKPVHMEFRRRRRAVKRATNWTRIAAVDLYFYMFGRTAAGREGGEARLRTRWAGKPLDLKILEHGTMSQEEIEHFSLVLSLEESKDERQKLTLPMRFSEKPLVPLFPAQGR